MHTLPVLIVNARTRKAERIKRLWGTGWKPTLSYRHGRCSWWWTTWRHQARGTARPQKAKSGDMRNAFLGWQGALRTAILLKLADFPYWLETWKSPYFKEFCYKWQYINLGGGGMDLLDVWGLYPERLSSVGVRLWPVAEITNADCFASLITSPFTL
jgi:hypothetical protein